MWGRRKNGEDIKTEGKAGTNSSKRQSKRERHRGLKERKSRKKGKGISKNEDCMNRVGALHFTMLEQKKDEIERKEKARESKVSTIARYLQNVRRTDIKTERN